MSSEKRKTFCVPGESLIKADDSVTTGEGVFVRFGYVHSAIGGVVSKEVDPESGKTKISVLPPSKRRVKIPQNGDIVTCKITAVGPTAGRAMIHCIGEDVLSHPFKGTIRKEDIREIEKGTTEPYKCFRVGDVVLARVVGVGEHHSFLLSTAEEELGVAVAYSKYNQETPMVPVNWTQMRCPKTYVKELRKVAKINFD